MVDSDTTVAQFDQPMRVAGLALGSADTLQWGRSDGMRVVFEKAGAVDVQISIGAH